MISSVVESNALLKNHADWLVDGKEEDHIKNMDHIKHTCYMPNQMMPGASSVPRRSW